MYISLFHKIAGKAEAKKVNGLNFEELRKKLISEGFEPTVEEIKEKLLDESNLAISNHEKDLILNLNLADSARKRVNEVEAALIIIGAVLSNSSDSKNIIDTFNWYLETKELSPGSLNIAPSSIFAVDSIKDTFNNIYEKVEEEKRKSDETSLLSKNDNYLSNEVVYDFGDGWKVVYVPAAGEMEEFPGLAGTSHDRILEGNKNGLCLGRELKLYQNNKRGKIYSIRDPKNKPRVTIRIDGDNLQEAKGKNNNPPDIESAEKADIWFKVLRDSNSNFNYKNNRDYINFPPLNADKAKELFNQDKDNSYKSGWAPYWYGKGIPELDEDVDDKIKNNDPILIKSGFGKHPIFFEKIKPVVIYWCNRYPESRDILFGTEYNLPYHEVFKTYKKLPEMHEVVRKLSEEENNVELFFKNGLHKIKEYEKYIHNAAKLYIEISPYNFLRNLSEESWAQDYIDLAAKNLAEKYPHTFLEDFSEKPWAQPYLDAAVKNTSEKYPYKFLSIFSDKPWAQPYIKLAAKNTAEKEPYKFLRYFSDKPWAQDYIDLAAKSVAKEDPRSFLRDFSYKPWAQDYIELAAKNLAEIDLISFLVEFSEKPWAQPYLAVGAEENPVNFLIHFSHKPWARDYLGVAAKGAAEKEPHRLLMDFSEKPWAKPYLDAAAKNTAEVEPTFFLSNFLYKPWAKDYLKLAAKNAAEKQPYIFLIKFSKEHWAQPYLDLAAKSCAEKDPYHLLLYFSEEPWAKPYLDVAAKIAAEEEPFNFLSYFSNKPWANTPVDSIGGKTWVWYAREIKSKKEASSIDIKLKKLSKFLLNNRYLEELSKLKVLLYF